MLYGVEVAVALSRPPKVEEYRWVVVEAKSALSARLLATQIACARADVVMPVWASEPVLLKVS